MDDLFRGQRVHLRPFEPEDAEALAGYLNHPSLAGRRSIPWKFPDLAPLSRQQVQGVIEAWAGEEKGLPLAVVRAADGALVGHAEASWEWDPLGPSVSVTIDPTHQRQGYGSEALGLLLRFLFDTTPAESVVGWVAEWNEAGLRFVERHGFRAGGRMRRAGLRGGRSFDYIVTDLLRAEWQARKGGPDAA